MRPRTEMSRDETNVVQSAKYRIVNPLMTWVSIGRVSRRLFRRAFAFDPHFAIVEKLFLPDRHSAFEFTDRPLACGEGGTAVRSADGDDNAGFADLKAACAMDDADVGDLEEGVRLASESLHFAQRHWRVGFVDEVERLLASACELAHVAVERDGRAAF